jgi:hypothetical protein
LGSLIIVTFLREMTQSLIPWSFKDITDEMTFNTPEVESRDSESGPEVEFHTFGSRAGLGERQKDSLIEDIYLQFSMFASTSAPLRLVRAHLSSNARSRPR